MSTPQGQKITIVASINPEKQKKVSGKMQKYQDTYEDALRSNEENTKNWEKSKNNLITTETSLKEFIKYPNVDIMVPISNKALIPGKLIHTNEITVCHGSGIFSECSQQQALEIIQHRKKMCDERLKALEAEKQLFENKLKFSGNEDVFGKRDPECQEIVEMYDEEEEKKWQQRHAESLKKLKQQEAAERQKLKNGEKSDVDVLKLLEDLELMEELDEELENLKVTDDDTLSRLLNGEVAIVPSKPRISHYSKIEEKLEESNDQNSSETPEAALSYKTADASTEDLVLMLKSYRNKIKNIAGNLKKTDDKSLSLYMDLTDLEDEINDDIQVLDPDSLINSDDSEENEDETNADEISSEGESSKHSDEVTEELKQELKETCRQDSEIQAKSKRRVSFSSSLENIHIIESNGMPPVLPQNKTIQIHFRHSENLFIPGKFSTSSDYDIVQHPADFYTKFKSCFNSTTTKKSILKNKDKDLGVVSEKQKKSVVMEPEPVKSFENSYTIGTVMEHNGQANGTESIPESLPEISTKKKPSKFKLNRQKS